MERKEHPVGEVLIIPMRSSTSLSPQDSARPLPLQPSSPPPPLSLSSPQLQTEFLRRAPRAASPDNDSARHQNLLHQPSPSVSPSVSLFSSPPTPLSSPPPPLSLSSPQLQAEFLRRASRGLRTVSCDTSDVLTSPSSTLVSPFTSITSSTLTSPPQPLSSSMPTKEGCTTLLSLSSTELLTELCQSQSRPMKHVSVSKGLTTVFSGRGRGIKVRCVCHTTFFSGRGRGIKVKCVCVSHHCLLWTGQGHKGKVCVCVCVTHHCLLWTGQGHKES
nr:proline-rich protein 36-like isoform X1 [Oncorhynchus nerka]